VKSRILISLMVFVGGAILVPASVSGQAPVEARVLVWEFTPQDDGQVYALTSEGAEEVVFDFPQGVFASSAKPCSQDFWTADGKAIALFTGAEEGDIALYPMEGGEPVVLGRAHRMACAGPATFQFSPNGKRVGFISYAAESLSREFPYGDLMLFETESGAQVATFDWTTAFTLYDDGALMLRLYPDGVGNASEADLDWWDGAARQTIVTLEPLYPPDKPDVECGIRGGSVARVDDMAYVLTGQTCATGGSSWRLTAVSIEDGTITEIAGGQPGGGFFPESFTIQLIPAQDGTGFVVTVPSGLARNTVTLQWVSLDGTVTPLLEGEHVIVDRYGERLSEGRHMLVSMDGGGLAFVSATGDQVQTLWLLDLSTPGSEPISVEEEGRNQRIFQANWASNGALYYVAGSVESNSLQRIKLGESSQRLSRGRFFRLAVSYDGDKAAAAEWYANPDSAGDDLFKLTVLDTEGHQFTLKEGGKEHNQMIPLAIK
jgi:hypothetical protein